MKKQLLSIALSFAFSTMFATDIQISFSATGPISTVDTVKVENITKGTSVTLNGSDILVLRSATNSKDLKSDETIHVIPNPIDNEGEICFVVPQSGAVNIKIIDASGQLVASQIENLEVGSYSYQISGLSSGIYYVSVVGQKYAYKATIASIGTSSQTVVLKQKNAVHLETSSKLKSLKSLVTMDFTTDDRIRFIGKTGTFSDTIYRRPTINETITFHSININEFSNQWATINYKEYLVQNATWNVQAAINGWTQAIFCDTLTGMLGWKWDFSKEKEIQNALVVKTFPEVIYGKKPYSGIQSTTTKLPEKISTADFSLKYDYSLEATGTYNLSTDISFTDSMDPIEKNIRAKMMIWFAHQNYPFYESKSLTQATIDGLKYDIYVDTTNIGPEGKWVAISLIANDFPTNGTLHLKEYINYFLSQEILKKEWYLSSVEIGNEIVSGKGKMFFKEFEVSKK